MHITQLPLLIEKCIKKQTPVHYPTESINFKDSFHWQTHGQCGRTSNYHSVSTKASIPLPWSRLIEDDVDGAENDVVACNDMHSLPHST